MKRFLTMALAATTAALALGVLVAAPGAGAQTGPGTYRVTIENLTTGQPFSPPAVVTHDSSIHVWEMGQDASAGVQAIAEDGDPSVLDGALAGVGEVTDVSIFGGPILPGTSASILVHGDANDVLSVTTMLICTNDAFTGTDSVSLSNGSHDANAYDAGTEMNTELTADIVDPCGAAGPVMHDPDGNGHTGTSDPISAHTGIAGTGDLTAAHDWTDPVARISVEAVENMTYTVKVTNNSSGQPLTPPVIIAHLDGTNIFAVGQPASEGVRLIAENGDPMTLLDGLASDAFSPFVYNVVALGAPILPGAEAMATIEAPIGAKLSIVSMLICTNDGFTGVDGHTLAASGTDTIQAMAYDAGTEENTELTADLVDPCGAAGPVMHDADGNNRTATDGGVVTMHTGIAGTGDLTSAHAWSEPIATIMVTQGVVAPPTPTPAPTQPPTPAPTQPPAATPTMVAPAPPDTGTGLADEGGSAPWAAMLAVGALILVGTGSAAGVAIRRR